MQFIFRLAVLTLAVYFTCHILPGAKVNNVFTAIIVAAVLAFLNSILKPIMILLTIPITVFTFGLFLLFINAFIVIIADKLVDGFETSSFFNALVFGIILWVVTFVLEFLGRSKDVANN